MTTPTSLDEQLAAFRHNRFLALPLAGLLVWAAIGIVGALASPGVAALAVYVGTGSIFYLGLGVARLTGEDLLGRKRRGNFFDRVFLAAMASALCVFALAIPFGLLEPTAVPLSVGVLSGLMWLPLSPLLGHWVGYFHTVARTVLLVAAWYVFPEHRFVVLPAVIVGVYLVSLWALHRRWTRLQAATSGPRAKVSRAAAVTTLVAPVAAGLAMMSAMVVALRDLGVAAGLGVATTIVFYLARRRPCF